MPRKDANELLEVVCCDCGNKFKMKTSYYFERKRGNHKIRCKSCAIIHKSEAIKARISSLSAEEKERISQSKSISLKKYWDDIDPKEKEDRSISIKNHLANLSQEEMDKRMQAIHDGHMKFRKNMTIADKKLFYGNMKRLESLSRGDQLKWLQSQTQGISKSESLRGVSEGNFINDIKLMGLMAGIHYDWGYASSIVHQDFDKLFPNNPHTKSNVVNPYHAWDFIIYGTAKNILIDIDGSIHNVAEFDIVRNLKSKKSQAGTYRLSSHIQFNDSQRPYQTDGMDAYIIECYNDKLADDTRVLNLQTGDYMTYKKFKNYIQFIILSDKEIKKIMKDCQ